MEKKQTTQERILDAAETLFADMGFHGTSMRQITSLAKVNLASINYHFGSKDRLIGEVFKRRMIPLNNIRTDRLEKIIEVADSESAFPSLEEIVRCFIEPVEEMFDHDPGYRKIPVLISHAMTTPDDSIRETFMNVMTPFFKTFFAAFCRALPGVPEAVVFSRFHFSIGAVSHVFRMINQSTEELSAKMILKSGTAPDRNTFTEMLIEYVVKGMEA